MILVPLLASATAITLGAFWLADRVHRRMHELDVADDPATQERRRVATDEKRRILERDRKEWLVGLALEDRDLRIGATRRIGEIDKQLLELADE